jgi:hypothetical protein
MNPAARPTIERAMDRQDQRQRDLVQLLGDQYAAHPAMTPLIALVIERLYMLRLTYMQAGRGREAHGVGRSIQMVWHTVVKAYQPPRVDFAPTFPIGFDEGAP